MLVLREAVTDLVVVAPVVHVDMDAEMGACGSIKRAHGDGDCRLMDRIPEERRAADRAKPASHSFGGVEPSELVGALDLQGFGGYVGGCPIVS